MKKELIVVQRNSFIRGYFSNIEIRDMKILKLLVSKVNATEINLMTIIPFQKIKLDYFNSMKEIFITI